MKKIKNYGENLKILLVEDEHYTQVKLVKILRRVCDNILVAKNGEDALLLLKHSYTKKEPFDLIISDIDMPIMNGIEFLEKVRQIDEVLPFIFITGQLELDSLLKVIKLNVDDYILKPIEIIPLLESIEKTIRKKYKKVFLSLEKNIINLSSDMYWDTTQKALYIEKKIFNLTKKETLLLDTLCSNINIVITTEALIYTLWTEAFDMESNLSNLKNLISRIRIKIPSLHIENVYGLGYRIRSAYEL